MLATTLLAYRSQIILPDGRVKFEKSYFILAFLIHWFFIAFSRTGTDHVQYVDIIMYKADFFLERGEEPGFNGMCIFLRKLIGNPEIIIFLYKTATLILYYVTFWLLRNHANMLYMMIAYNGGLYLWSFIVLAQTMAVSMVLLSSALVVRGYKMYWPIIISIMAYTIHASALIMVAVFLIIAIMKRPNIKIGGVLLLLMLGVVILIVRNIHIIYGWAITEVGGFAQYEAHEEAQNKGVGWFNYIFYGYLLVSFLLPILKNKKMDFIRNQTIVFYLYGFASAVAGYYLGSTRLNYYTYVLFLILIPCYFLIGRNKFIIKNKSILWHLQNATWMIYLLFIALGNLLDASNPKSISDMYNYSLFNPFA